MPRRERNLDDPLNVSERIRWALSATPKRTLNSVLVVLVTFANAEGESCWPSRETIAQTFFREAEPSDRQKNKISEYLAELKRLGLVSSLERFTASGQQRSNGYSIAVPRTVRELPDWMVPPQIGEPPSPDWGAPPSPGRVAHEQPEDQPLNNQMAPAGAGPTGPTAATPESAIVALAMLGRRAAVDEVRGWWPADITDDDAETIALALDSDSFFFGFSRVSEISALADGAEFAFAVALGMECARNRLPSTELTAAQVWKIANELRGDLDVTRAEAMLGPNGLAATFWHDPPGRVGDVVGLIVGSVRRAMEQEKAILDG